MTIGSDDARITDYACLLLAGSKRRMNIIKKALLPCFAGGPDSRPEIENPMYSKVMYRIDYRLSLPYI